VLSLRDDGTRTKMKRAGLAPVEKAEGYALVVAEDGILLDAHDPAGAFYGTLTLLQLFDREQSGFRCARVRDWPHFVYRGTRLHLPKPGEFEPFNNFIRMLGFLRVNQVWFRDLYVRRLADSVRLPRCGGPEHPDALDKTRVEQLGKFAARHAVWLNASMMPSSWFFVRDPSLVELAPGEDLKTVYIKSRATGHVKLPWPMGSRFNLCPSNEKTYELAFKLMDELIDMFPGPYFDIGVDEFYQDYNGSRWGVCPRCRGKDPVKLLADYINRMAGHAISRGKIPIVNSTMLLRGHGGYYKDAYKAADLIRKDVVINNWSEGHIRRRFSGPIKRPTDAQIARCKWESEKEYGRMMASLTEEEIKELAHFKATEYFRRKGINKVIHMINVGKRWRGRPELREVHGKLDAHGVFTTYYSGPIRGVYPAFASDALEKNGLMGELAFTAEHAWTPDVPAMDSAEEARQIDYAYAVMKALREGKTFLDAIDRGRKKPERPFGWEER